MIMWYPRSVYRVFDRIRAKRSGARRWPASFADRLTHPMPGSRAVRKLMSEGGMRPDLSQASRIPVHAGDGTLPPVAAGEVGATWVGHATFVLRMAGMVILTDPVWSRRIPGVQARMTPPGLPFEALPAVDAVVISHNHFDHLDLPTIRRLPRRTPILVPGGLGWWFRRLGFTQVIELDWWESVQLGAVTLRFVPSHHWSRRTLFDGCRSLWGGWVLTGDEGTLGARTVYFAGDSAYGPYLSEIGARSPQIDLALMPVGAYLPRWFMKPLHMNPAEAVRGCADLGARRMATMHWGTFALSAESPMAPLEPARQAWRDSGRSDDDLWDLSVGQTRVLAPRTAGEPLPTGLAS
jgi:L-ascorbate metabolism protein UlaG (beta-lactamase superfamily)